MDLPGGIPESPASFDAIFQQQQRQVSGGSGSSSTDYPSNLPNMVTGQFLSDEPPDLHRKGSKGSLHSQTKALRQRSGSGASSLRHDSMGGSSRQDSIPWKSTLLNTAGGDAGGIGGYGSCGMGQSSQGNIGQEAQQYSGQVWQQRAPDAFGQFQASSTPNYNPPTAYTNPMMNSQPYAQNGTSAHGAYHGGSAASMSMDANNLSTDQFGFNQASPFSGFSTGTPGMNSQDNWLNDALTANGLFQDDGNSNGVGGLGANGDMGRQDNETFEELLQTLSRAASREPSPGPQIDNFFLQQQHHTPLQAFTPESAYSQHDSGGQSQSGSPFPATNAPSPSYASASIPRPGSSSGNYPPFHKPHSPPALVMPNNAPSPSVLPPIVTQPTSNGGIGTGGQGHALANQMGGMGGLLPPTNPALQHLSVMMGISPIAPNADGPQIFVQPSTPISGLKDGRGHFDAALRRAAQLAQSNQGSSSQDPMSQQQSNHFGQAHSNGRSPSPHGSPYQQHQQPQQVPGNGMDFNSQMMQNAAGWGNLGAAMQNQTMRPRAKSDSYAPASGGINPGEFERQAMVQLLAQAQAMGLGQGMQGMQNMSAQSPFDNDASGNIGEDNLYGNTDWRNNVGAWLSNMGMANQPGFAAPPAGSSGDMAQGTVNPNQLPGNDQASFFRQMEQQHQLSQLQAQKQKLNPLSLDTNTDASSNVLKYEPGEFSPTSLAFYQQRGMLPPAPSAAASAPFYNTSFNNTQHAQMDQYNGHDFRTQAAQFFLSAGGDANGASSSSRRRSFAGGSGTGSHHATGAGTPGYGMGFVQQNRAPSPFGTLDPSKMRGLSPNRAQGHRRTAKSEDLGRGGWGLGQAGSTTDFLNSITANDGSLIPPVRGRTHSRHSSASSGRSASPALSVSSQGSSFSRASGSGHGHMDMPEGTHFVSQDQDGSGDAAPTSGAATASSRAKAKMAKMKVTSMATEVAATSRRTNSGIFQCPVPGCGSTFTRHFNLKGHMRSHNDERPYKCLYDGCPKAETGFARQHDCKRHMLLHQGLRPFECDGCNKKFARLDALTRHHKSEQGQECAIAFPLPTNPDGSPLSESQYKAYKAAEERLAPAPPAGPSGKKGRSRASSFASVGSAKSGDESDMGATNGGGPGMEEYDRI